MFFKIMVASGATMLMQNGFPYTIHLKEMSILFLERFKIKLVVQKSKVYSKYEEAILALKKVASKILEKVITKDIKN